VSRYDFQNYVKQIKIYSLEFIMQIKFYPGFTVLSQDANPAFVAPHSGPGFDFSDSRDEKTDVIAGLCLEKLGGKVIISGISRRKAAGVDFNRLPPPMRLALKMHQFIETGEMNQQKWYDYRIKYAWTAADNDDYQQRLGIYKKFWHEVDKSETIVVIHRMVMDIFSQGFKEKSVKSAVHEMNKRYGDFFKRIKKDFADFLVMEEKRRMAYVMCTPPHKLEKESTDHMNNHMKILGVKDMNEVIPAFKKYLEKKSAPKITVEKLFNGSLSYGLTNISGEKRLLQFEVTSFLCNWYPDKASEIICEILNMVESEHK